MVGRLLCWTLAGLIASLAPAVAFSRSTGTQVGDHASTLDRANLPDVGTAEPDAFDWVRPRFGSSTADRANWRDLLDAAQGLGDARALEVARSLETRHIQSRPPAGDGCWGSEACAWVIRIDRLTRAIGSWEAFVIAWREARPAVAAVRALAGAGQTASLNTGTDIDTELRTRFAEDQRLRAALATPPTPLSEHALQLYRLSVGMMVSRSDRENAAWLNALVTTSGWPRPPQVSREGELAAWFMVVHARHDPAFRFAMLAEMRQAAERGLATHAQYAARFDHILFETSGVQRYGTKGDCVEGRFVPAPVEDSTQVIPLRREMGLPTLAEQAEIMAPACAETARAGTPGIAGGGPVQNSR